MCRPDDGWAADFFPRTSRGGVVTAASGSRCVVRNTGQTPHRGQAVGSCGPVPLEWRRPAHRVTDRSATATMTASSTYPSTGMKSGTRSTGSSRYPTRRAPRIRTPRAAPDRGPGGGSSARYPGAAATCPGGTCGTTSSAPLEDTVVRYRPDLRPPTEPAGPDALTSGTEIDCSTGTADTEAMAGRLTTRTRERHTAVHQLVPNGTTMSAISRKPSLDRKTVHRFARVHHFDELLTTGSPARPPRPRRPGRIRW